MSNLLDILFADENRQAIEQMQKNFNLSEKETKVAVEGLIPALSRGLQKNTQTATGMDDLLEALRTGEHKRYMEQPDTLGSNDTVNDGNDILGHIFGEKKVSREVANRVSQNAGISSTVLKKMLPVLATVLMGAMSKKVISGGSRRTANTGASGILGTLLDSDRDGSIWDDVLGMAAKSMLR